MKNNLNFYRPTSNLSLIDRASEIYSNLKLVGELVEIETWYHLDNSPFNINNDENKFVEKVLGVFVDNFKEFTTTAKVDQNIKPNSSNVYSVFGSDKFDEGPIVMQVITASEIEVVLKKYKQFMLEEDNINSLIDRMASDKGFILDTDF